MTIMTSLLDCESHSNDISASLEQLIAKDTLKNCNSSTHLRNISERVSRNTAISGGQADSHEVLTLIIGTLHWLCQT
jgi:hypothetical protein